MEFQVANENPLPRPGSESALAPFERPLLVAIARRMPASVRPDHLTLLGFAGAAIVFAGGGLSNYSRYFLLLVVLGIALNWLGDSLDGTVARLRQIERPRYGYFVDHGCDLFSIILIGFGFGLSPYMSLATAAIGIVGYLTFMVCALLRQHIRGVLQIAYAGIGPTEIRIFIIALAISYFILPPQLLTFNGEWKIYPREAAIIACVFVEMVVLFFFMIAEARDVARSDPLREHSSRHTDNVVKIKNAG